MGIAVRAMPALFLLLLLSSGTALAQCQLAFNEQTAEEVDIETLLDLSLFEDIDPATEVFTDFPVCNLDLLEGYAYSLFETGEYDLQARIYNYILRHDRNFVVMYNLACCYSRMGMAEKALEYLEHSLRFGYEDLDWIEQDTDMDIVRSFPRYQEIMDLQREVLALRDAQQGAEIFVECPSMFSCRVVLPEGFDPAVEHTLVIGLHGAGDSAARFGTLAGYFGENDFIYAAPQAPFAVPRENGGSVWFQGPVEAGGEYDRLTRGQLVTYVENVIEQMEDSYSIDSVYLIGFSQGAAVSYIAGIGRPGMVDGIVAFGGGIDPGWFSEEELSGASDLRVFIAHGSEDGIERAEASRDLLAGRGYDVTFREFQGGHFIHLDTLHEAVEWIRQ